MKNIYMYGVMALLAMGLCKSLNAMEGGVQKIYPEAIKSDSWDSSQWRIVDFAATVNKDEPIILIIERTLLRSQLGDPYDFSAKQRITAYNIETGKLLWEISGKDIDGYPSLITSKIGQYFCLSQNLYPKTLIFDIQSGKKVSEIEAFTPNRFSQNGESVVGHYNDQGNRIESEIDLINLRIDAVAGETCASFDSAGKKLFINKISNSDCSKKPLASNFSYEVDDSHNDNLRLLDKKTKNVLTVLENYKENGEIYNKKVSYQRIGSYLICHIRHLLDLNNLYWKKDNELVRVGAIVKYDLKKMLPILSSGSDDIEMD